MMENLPAHMRIAILNPSNDDVNARRAAIEELSESWKEITDVATILTKAEMIARSLGGDGRPAAELGMEVQQALQKHASAFLYEESVLDVGVCAGMAALSVLAPAPDSSGWRVADVYSNALWSALAIQPQLTDDKRERLRREVLSRARDRSRASAESARERSAVPDLGDLVVTIPESGKPTTNFRKATFATIEALRRNALLDREEIDFLWWIQLNRSRLLKRKIDAMPEPLRLVSLAVEAVGHLRRLPADLHYELVLRSVDEDPGLDLSALLKEIGSDRATLAAGFDAPRAARNPGVFPLLHAIASGNAKIPGAKVKRSASTWAGQALLEAGLMRMIGNGLPKS